MALTLTEAAKLSNDVLLAGVIETITQEGGILAHLPFIGIQGNGLTYNRENVPATADFYQVGDDWDESTPTFTQATATLTILGGDADVDNFLKATRSNVQDLEAAVIGLKAKAVSNLFEDTFINGNVTANPRSFDGLDTLATVGQTVTSGTNGASLTLARLDELLDRIRGGKPDAIIMSRRTRRSLQVLARATNFLEADRDEFGMWRHYYNAVPILVNDHVADDKVVGTSTDCSTVYACRFGEEAVAGLHSGMHPGVVSVEEVGDLETKDASRYRVKMYASLALFNAVALARLTGVRP